MARARIVSWLTCQWLTKFDIDSPHADFFLETIGWTATHWEPLSSRSRVVACILHRHILSTTNAFFKRTSKSLSLVVIKTMHIIKQYQSAIDVTIQMLVYERSLSKSGENTINTSQCKPWGRWCLSIHFQLHRFQVRCPQLQYLSHLNFANFITIQSQNIRYQ